MGLPHVLVRFYTNPDGRAARRTTLVVLALLGVLLPVPDRSTARSAGVYAPELLLTGRHRRRRAAAAARGCSAAPGRRCCSAPGRGRGVRGVPVDASGLTMSVAGVLSQDLLRGRCASVSGFRVGAALAVAVPVVLSLLGAARPAWPTPWGSPSRWPRRRSARCSCSASGGAG